MRKVSGGMKKIKGNLSVHLTESDLREIAQNYHIPEAEWRLIGHFAATMDDLLSVSYFGVRYDRGEGLAEVEYNDYVVLFLSIGPYTDQLQDVYLAKELLMQAYIINCIGLAYLKKAYKEVVRSVQNETGKWVQKLDFLGDTYPMSMLPDMYAAAEPEGIRYNEQFMLIPEKSVVLILPLGEENKEKSVCEICSRCKNVNCVLRDTSSGHRMMQEAALSGANVILEKNKKPQNYGFSRIFGDQKT